VYVEVNCTVHIVYFKHIQQEYSNISIRIFNYSNSASSYTAPPPRSPVTPPWSRSARRALYRAVWGCRRCFPCCSRLCDEKERERVIMRERDIVICVWVVAVGCRWWVVSGGGGLAVWLTVGCELLWGIVVGGGGWR
jgi:hypothetical protein